MADTPSNTSVRQNISRRRGAHHNMAAVGPSMSASPKITTRTTNLRGTSITLPPSSPLSAEIYDNECSCCAGVSSDIICSSCEKYYHAQCENIRPSALMALNDSDMPYICIDCRPAYQSSSIGKYMRGNDSRMESIEDNIRTLNTKITEISAKILFNDREEFENAVKGIVHTETKEIVQNESNELKAEFREINARKNRIMISGMPENSDERSQINELATEIELDIGGVRKTYRPPNKPGVTSPRLLNIEFWSEKDKHQFLCREIFVKLTNLATTSKFKGIIVFDDQTFKQRAAFRLLKQEQTTKNQVLADQGIRDRKWVINRIKGKVIEKNITPETVSET